MGVGWNGLGEERVMVGMIVGDLGRMGSPAKVVCEITLGKLGRDIGMIIL